MAPVIQAAGYPGRVPRYPGGIQAGVRRPGHSQDRVVAPPGHASRRELPGIESLQPGGPPPGSIATGRRYPAGRSIAGSHASGRRLSGFGSRRVVRRPAPSPSRRRIIQDRESSPSGPPPGSMPPGGGYPGSGPAPSGPPPGSPPPGSPPQGIPPGAVRVRVEFGVHDAPGSTAVSWRPVVAAFRRLEWTLRIRVRVLAAAGLPERMLAAFLLLVCRRLVALACWDLVRPARA